jgi:anti-sigma regulatory factor (Ser/Thr protein kinase)
MESVSIPATLDSLPAIGQHVGAAAERAGLDRSRAYRLRLAVDEIATNIILHGQPDPAAAAIDLTIDLAPDALTIALEDSGPEYDPRRQPAPEGLDRPLAERSAGGLGVYLALRAVDRFAYQRINGRNRNIFTMARSSSPSREP